ncbi:DUF2334 domain-containing protein [Cerasicoccus arenae]|uniref:Polysaccharide deacetylase n=1 Tax=Cerasicoccus arenae TaxID=424488 RepID=A0A8J3GE65_9BACT|nr:DUF2334 domain-containing protein [Cerasicoccus arenae]MBK1858133.1 DUF2334 domain-containing protein [Cerasicoccus arenae]GHB96697.1 hypothetical protein GCM10007047_10760 [Cerasicoccus arenae]
MMSLSNGYAESDAPIVVIKADDLVYRTEADPFGEGWSRFIELAQEKNIKVSIGIICNSLEKGTPKYIEAIQKLNDSGQIEFWNHGFTHSRNKDTGKSEFKGPSLEEQLETISKSQALAEEKLGFTFHSFGTPYNAADGNTPRALREHSELTSWMFGPSNAQLLPGQMILGRSVNLEQPVHHPNFEGFKKSFESKEDEPYYVLQAHPGGWDKARLEQFALVVDYLQSKGAVFMTPTELQERLSADK